MEKKINYRKYTIEFVKERAIKEGGPDYTLLSTAYKTRKDPLLWKHNICGNTFLMTGDGFFNRHNRCPHCNGGHKFTDEQFFKKILECEDGKNYEILESYKGTHVGIKFRHKKCGREFIMRPNNFIIKGNRCPLCAEDEHDNRKSSIHSKSEDKIAEHLESKNIKFEREVKFKETGRLRFDFKVYLNNETYFLIEYDGRFHRKPKEGCSEKTFKKYEKQVENDNKKNKFCNDNNITLLRSTNVDTMIKLIDNKLNDYPNGGENPQ